MSIGTLQNSKWAKVIAGLVSSGVLTALFAAGCAGIKAWAQGQDDHKQIITNTAAVKVLQDDGTATKIRAERIETKVDLLLDISRRMEQHLLERSR